MYNWDHENCLLYGVAGCPLFRGCLNFEVNGRTVGTFSISWVSIKRDSTVDLNIAYISEISSRLSPHGHQKVGWGTENEAYTKAVLSLQATSMHISSMSIWPLEKICEVSKIGRAMA